MVDASREERENLRRCTERYIDEGLQCSTM
jgi:hypothetical protein